LPRSGAVRIPRPGPTWPWMSPLPTRPSPACRRLAHPRGGQFQLAGYEDGLVRWGRLSPKLPMVSWRMKRVLLRPRPLSASRSFCRAMKITPGDQLVAIGLTSSSTVSGGYNLSAIVQPWRRLACCPSGSGHDRSWHRSKHRANRRRSSRRRAPCLSPGAFPSRGERQLSSYSRPMRSMRLGVQRYSTINNPASVPNWQCWTAANGSMGISFGVVIPQVNASGNIDSLISEFRYHEAGAKTDMAYPLSAVVTSCHIVGRLPLQVAILWL